jgi:transcriptional regulator with AAA-type ATPase domain
MTGSIVREVLDALKRARTFEEAALPVARRLLSEAEDALGNSAYAGRGRLLRATVHLRPDDGYRRLVSVEASDGSLQAVIQPETRLPSTTAWRWVFEHRCPVVLDVALGKVEPLIEGSGVIEGRRMPAMLGAEASQQRLLGRNATSVLVLPLEAPSNRVAGMIAVEADCRAAAGSAFIWQSCLERLRLIADLAGPFLTTLPSASSPVESPDDLLPVVGASMSPLIQLLRVFAQQDETILINGPTGSGKSRLAKWCHARSPRANGPFELLDLSTVPEELQLGELFGWRKGAFTGAIRDNAGAIARADRGTVFIDEIDKLSMRAQAGLLYVLEERAYRVLGDDGGERRANVRFIVGTNANLQAEVAAGRFRQDLYYRINVLPVRLPALADRADEIPLWARFMLARRHEESVPGGTAAIAGGAERMLASQVWHGNLRQLDNIVRRAYTMAVMEHGGTAARDLELSEPHVARALSYEGGETEGSLVDSLRRAAVAFVNDAERARLRGEVLDLDMAEAFKGFVLGASSEKLGGVVEAMSLFGRDALVKSRNHHKLVRRELERVEALCRAVGHPAGSPFSAMLANDD